MRFGNHDDSHAFIADYLKSARVLIVDLNSGARVGLKKLIISLGARLNQVFLAASFEEAETYLEKEKPDLVFCDYQLDSGKFGIDLLQKHRERLEKEGKKSIFILVTSNTSQSAVAQAAEEDIDAYILKPYTIDGFTLSLSRAIQIKFHPDEYQRLIHSGKDLLDQNQFEEAIAVFTEAMKKNSKPSLACYYEGLTYFKKAFIENSEKSYIKGLGFNKIHYKCLVGLFDLLMGLKKYESAYEVVQRIIRFFPANPNRLATVLRLAIQTKHFSDIETFYEEFVKIEDRTDDLVKSISAALIVCGKYFFESKENQLGVDLIQKASVTAAGRSFLLKKAIEALIQYGELDEAKSVLKRFSNTSNEDPHFQVANFLVSSKESKAEWGASRGQELLQKGIRDLSVYETTISCFEKLGKSERVSELAQDVAKLYPNAERFHGKNSK